MEGLARIAGAPGPVGRRPPAPHPAHIAWGRARAEAFLRGRRAPPCEKTPPQFMQKQSSAKWPLSPHRGNARPRWKTPARTLPRAPCTGSVAGGGLPTGSPGPVMRKQPNSAKWPLSPHRESARPRRKAPARTLPRTPCMGDGCRRGPSCGAAGPHYAKKTFPMHARMETGKGKA